METKEHGPSPLAPPGASPIAEAGATHPEGCAMIGGGRPEKLGILGGVGPRATATLYLDVVERVWAVNRAYPSVAIDSLPIQAELERAHCAGASAAPVEAAMAAHLTCAARSLRAGGATFLALPCNTLHVYTAQIADAAELPLLDMVALTVARAAALPGGRIGVLGTRATCQQGVYQRAAERHGVRCVYPRDEAQGIVDRCIQATLVAAPAPAALADLRSVADELAGDVDVLVLACTELAVLARGELPGLPVLSSLEELTVACTERLLGGMDVP